MLKSLGQVKMTEIVLLAININFLLHFINSQDNMFQLSIRGHLQVYIHRKEPEMLKHISLISTKGNKDFTFILQCMYSTPHCIKLVHRHLDMSHCATNESNNTVRNMSMYSSATRDKWECYCLASCHT